MTRTMTEVAGLEGENERRRQEILELEDSLAVDMVDATEAFFAKFPELLT